MIVSNLIECPCAAVVGLFLAGGEGEKKDDTFLRGLGSLEIAELSIEA
jgi:hypothetical protein